MTIYSKAPIVECVIDIQIPEAEDRSLALVQKAVELRKSAFPSSIPVRVFQLAFENEDGGDVKARHQEDILGVRLDRPAQDRILQIRRNGLSYFHLAPYSRWSQFRLEAQNEWSIYSDTMGCADATRVAIRTINRLPIVEGDDWRVLNISPNFPEALSRGISRVTMQLESAMPDVDPQAKFLLGLYNAPPGAEPALMLDIDVFIERQILAEDIFGTLDLLSKKKDAIFESCITETIRERIR